MAERENATCPTDVSAGSVPDDVSGVKADVSIDWSMLTSQQSTSSQWGPRVSGPTCQPQPEADAWDPRVSWVKRKKGVAAWSTGLKEEKGRLGLAQEARLGFLDRLSLLNWAMAHRLPLTLSLTGWARGAFQRLPLTSGARLSVRRRIQCGRTGSSAAAGLCGCVCVRGRLREEST